MCLIPLFTITHLLLSICEVFFITQGVPTSAMERFCNLKQRPGQDISSYYYEFEKLVKAVYQDRDPDEDFVFKKFLSSLYGDYKRLMLMKNPDTLKEALDESRRLESNGCTGTIDHLPIFTLSIK